MRLPLFFWSIVPYLAKRGRCFCKCKITHHFFELCAFCFSKVDKSSHLSLWIGWIFFSAQCGCLPWSTVRRFFMLIAKLNYSRGSDRVAATVGESGSDSSCTTLERKRPGLCCRLRFVCCARLHTMISVPWGFWSRGSMGGGAGYLFRFFSMRFLR